MPEIGGQSGQKANDGPNIHQQANGLNNIIASQNRVQNQSQANTPANEALATKGVITLDDDKNVVVRFYDDKGKVVAQFPPEDYIKMMKELNQVAESLFHIKA